MQLYRSELIFYLSVYIAYLVYSLYAALSVNDKIIEIAKFPFASGWSFTGRQRDDSNDEQEFFNEFISRYWYWYLIHSATSALCRYHMPKQQSIAHAVVGVLALICIIQAWTLCFFLLVLLSYYFCAISKSKICIWAISGLWLWAVTWIKNSTPAYNALGHGQHFILILLISWSVLRCCSFGLCLINKESTEQLKDGSYSLKHFLGYTLYFPSMIYGPYFGYHRYTIAMETVEDVKPIDLPQLFQHLQRLALRLLRIYGWWLFMRFSLHFVYIHYMMRDVNTVKLIPQFSQYGIGYFMGQFFFMFYVITYGLGIAFARYDGLNPPDPPKCIGRIHYYSDMWKYFDEGLYEFLFMHIYCELCSKDSPLWRKLAAATLTFTFVFVWHGCYRYVFVWSVLNLIFLIAEKVLSAFLQSSFYSKWTMRFFGAGISYRLRALLGCQLFIPSALSNIYFLCSLESGNYFMRGTYRGGMLNYIALIFCGYCYFQCCEVLVNVKKKKKTDLKTL